jgi:hypothetical protein
VLIGVTAGGLAYAGRINGWANPGSRLWPGNCATRRGLAATNIIRLPEEVLTYRSEAMPVTREELDWLPADTTYGYRRYIGPDGSGSICGWY